ncbi:MAG: hypothetical protein HY821_05915 [Acidobacteria bacterium]|nr:hypothetical protein [Acidobacteriota bacterium]
MGQPVSRKSDRSFVPQDSHNRSCCTHAAIGPAVEGSQNVIVNSLPALRVGDAGVHSTCCGPNTWLAKTGSSTVLVNGRRIHRLKDIDQHCGGPGYMVDGSPDVIAGG